MNRQDTSPLATKWESSKAEKTLEVNSELPAKQFQFKLRTQGTSGTLIYARERGKKLEGQIAISNDIRITAGLMDYKK